MLCNKLDQVFTYLALFGKVACDSPKFMVFFLVFWFSVIIYHSSQYLESVKKFDKDSNIYNHFINCSLGFHFLQWMVNDIFAVFVKYYNQGGQTSFLQDKHERYGIVFLCVSNIFIEQMRILSTLPKMVTLGYFPE